MEDPTTCRTLFATPSGVLIGIQVSVCVGRGQVNMPCVIRHCFRESMGVMVQWPHAVKGTANIERINSFHRLLPNSFFSKTWSFHTPAKILSSVRLDIGRCLVVT